jgi:hypothetical protein
MLGLTMALALLDPATAGDRWQLVALTALAAGWHLAFQRLGLTDCACPWPSRRRWP